MDLPENEDIKESIITIQDFPFICRICCVKRTDLRLFQEEYLLDLFQGVCKIDIRRAAHLPRKICDECINKLEDIITFIEISKSHTRLEKMLIPKKEIECVQIVERGTSREHSGTTGDNEEDTNIQKSRICCVCSCPGSLISFEGKAHLMQLFQNITNIDLKPAMNFACSEGICDKCIDKLEEISSFISLSSINDVNLENIVRNTAVKAEWFPEENIGIGIDLKSENVDDENEGVIENDGSLRETEGEFERIDVKEEVADDELAGSVAQNCLSESELFPRLQTEDKPFKCDDCEKSFNQKGHLKQHQLTHSGEKPFVCDRCESSFTRKNHLQRHLLTHAGLKPFSCDRCEKSFTQKGYLKAHMLSHAGIKPYKCDQCEKSFSCKNNLNNHCLTHTGDKPFQCERCDKSFTRKDILQRHSLTHSGERAFHCCFCGKSFVHKHHLQKHALTHAGERPFQCRSCDKGFDHKGDFEDHVLTHAPGTPFECDCCGKSFGRKHTLRRHLLTHTGERPFQCRDCEKKFIQKQHLQKHLLTHVGERQL